jgi:hypothetical protein
MGKIFIIISLIAISCTDSSPSFRIEKKFVIDSAWTEENPNGIPPQIEGKRKILVNGNKITVNGNFKKGDSITLYYIKNEGL